MVQIDIITEDSRWSDTGLETLAQRALDAAFDALELDPNLEVSLLACDDSRMSALNADFRGKARPTNVLSWPAVDLSAESPGAFPSTPDQDELELGDIAIAFETCQREAVDQDKPFGNHISHLLVHGLLHLLGYDHENDPDAALMEGTERRILAKLGIPDPY
ncbi:MAG: rRNA maturation RNase YbeY [Pseudomonadota bacterium]